MNNKLSSPSGTIWFEDGTSCDDVAWMIEGMDDEIEALTDNDLYEIAKANADIRNNYNEEGDVIDDQDVRDAVIDLRRIIENRVKENRVK